MIRNPPIILFNRQYESDYGISFETVLARQIFKHVNGVPRFLIVVQIENIARESENFTEKFVRYAIN